MNSKIIPKTYTPNSNRGSPLAEFLEAVCFLKMYQIEMWQSYSKVGILEIEYLFLWSSVLGKIIVVDGLWHFGQRYPRFGSK